MARRVRDATKILDRLTGKDPKLRKRGEELHMRLRLVELDEDGKPQEGYLPPESTASEQLPDGGLVLVLHVGTDD